MIYLLRASLTLYQANLAKENALDMYWNNKPEESNAKEILEIVAYILEDMMKIKQH